MMESKGSTSKLDDMIRKQAANIKAFKRAVSNIDLEVINEKWELEDALNTLQSRWQQIDGLHWEMDGEMCGVDEEHDAIYGMNEITFINLKKMINKKLWSVSHREHSTPQMDIPIFTGKYNQWYSFKDLFNETIHNNLSLSNAQKMQFLKGKLRGEAEKIIQHLPISTENYNTCWELLNHRYNNIKLIFNTTINTLLGLPTMQQQSMSQIKKLHDVTLESIHGIKNLGVNVETWDPLLVNLLSQKLDHETYGDYVGSLQNPRALPVLQEFLNFLESKFTSLESTRRKQESHTQKANHDNKDYGSKNHHRVYNNQHSNNDKLFHKALHVSSFKCPLCGQQHGLFKCKKFLEMNDENKLKTVGKLKLCINCLFDHNGQQCISTKRCRNCEGAHNSILHDACKSGSPPTSNAFANRHQNNEHPKVSISTHVTGNDSTSEVILATALIRVEAIDGSHQILRALLDPGSQVSLIKEDAVKRLGLQKSRCKAIVMGIGEQHSNCKGKLTIHCTSTYNNFSFKSDVLIMDNLLGNLPIKTFDHPNWSHIENLKLADPEFYSSRPIDLLLNANVHGIILLPGLISGENPTQPIIQQTQLGWIIYGGGEQMPSYRCNVVLNNKSTSDIQRFWEIEDICEETILSSEDQECLDYYSTTTRRLADGRYEVRLPLKPNVNEKLGSSKEMAIAQFKHLERKFQKQPDLAKQYQLFINEYLTLGHMVPNRYNNTQTISCYLPHHAVQRAESTTTKLRVVFNASARTTSGNSVNDLMLKGPNLQKDLQELMIKWRQFRYVFTADIEKMYRQIMVNAADRQYQQIVWRDSQHQPIETYQLATVTYGTKSAPFLAMMTLRQLAKDEEHTYPEAAKVLNDSFYVDDLIHGSHSVQEGKLLIADLNKLLRSGGFRLRKWSANNPKLLTNMDNSGSDGEIIFNFKSENTSKTLGLRWNSVDDQFMFQYNLENLNTKLTKRILLAEISKLFDPLGWIAPVSTKLKLLFQKVWIGDHLDWDEEVPENIKQEWNTLRTDLDNINEYKIPRWIGYQPHDVIELHGYCDASTKAYAAVIYARIKTTNRLSVVLVVAKSRLVPLSKGITLPKLELSGAYLLGKLMKKVISCLGEQKVRVYGWTDSMVVLGWLQGDPGRWKQFVANRTKSITEVIRSDHWYHIKSEENPADAASRGIFASQLKDHKLWWQGPNSLKSFVENSTSAAKNNPFTTDQELKGKYVQGQQSNAITENIHLESIIMNQLEKHSNFTTIIKIIAWLLRATKTMQFTNNATLAKHRSLPSYLTLRELQTAKWLIIKHIQRSAFCEEIEHLKKHGTLSNKSNLLNLNPFIDREGILRVGGRIRKAEIGMDMKHPAIIPNSSRLTTLLINQAHHLTYHGGPRLTLANIRQRYWIIGGINAVKKEVRNCVLCRKHSPNMQHQLMGDLPEARSNPAHPFYHTGIDYTGYVEVKSNKGRGIKTSKGYIAIFVCMVTRALHLELVSDLSSSAFLAALRRMAARRGAPRHIYSDNGTNFVGANRALQEQYHDLQTMVDDNLLAELADLQIQWHFNAPSWPSAGGLWERAVRSLKHHLKRVVGEQKLTFEEYTTVLAQLESCLNSRPLCALSEDIDDLEILTPAHFLIGRSGTSIIETEQDARTRWTLSARITHDIWKKWKSEYLTQLSIRPKWAKPQDNIKVGQLVTIQDDHLPPGKWMMGRVVELHPGQDEYVRVVTLKTKSGIIKRPIVKLSILPISSSKEKEEKKKQEENKSEISHTRVKMHKPKSMFVSMAISLIIFMSLITTSQTAETIISPLPNNISLYFDSINKMQLVRDKWTLVVYYNMSPYWDGMTAATKFLDYLNRTCNTLSETNRCSTLLLQLQHEYSELLHYNRLLMNQHFDAHARQRRGLINGVGYVANALFGVLDENFAEQYRKDIQIIKQNEHHLTNLLKNQTSIIEAEYNVLKRTEKHIQLQHKTINKHLNELDRAANVLKQNAEHLSDKQDFTLSAITAVNLLNNLNSIQNILLDTITDIYHGKLNSHLLTPEQLKDELQFISGQLTKDVTLPVNNIQTDLRLVYSLLKVKARVMTDYVILEITFPLSSRDSYEIYKVIPVPHQIGTNMLNVFPVADYIAINLKKDAYLTLSSMELQLCQHIKYSYLCSINKPVRYLAIDEKFCKNNLAVNQCAVRKSLCKDIWIELNDASKYFYFCCNTYPIRVICQDQVTYRQVTGAGIINLKPKCIIKGKDFALYSHSESGNTIKSDPGIETPQITELHHLVNISLSNYTESADLLNITLEDIGKQINQLKTATANTKDEIDINLSPHDIHQYVICYSLLGAAVVAAAVVLWRRRKAARSLTQLVEPTVTYSPNSDSCSSEVKCSRKQSIVADRQPSEVIVSASNASLHSTKDQATSPITQPRHVAYGEVA